jgi:heat shock protein HslJ
MRIARLVAGLALAFFCLWSQAQTKPQKVRVTGTLTRVMAMGGESTGWAIQFDTAATFDGKQLTSVEVEFHKIKTLEQLENKRVKATGVLTHRQGVEMGDRTILVASSMKESTTAVPPPSTQAAPFSLSGSAWLLEDLAGSGVIDGAQATLTFPEAGKVAGNGSCNRFFGPAKISGDTLELGSLGSTRMACPEAVMNQETKFLNALQAAERFEWKDPYLLIYCKGVEKPLRFTRMPSPTAAQ